MDILRAIGNTSMVRLRKVVPPECADVFVKLEWENPTGSMKDRMAEAATLSTIDSSASSRRSRSPSRVPELRQPHGTLQHKTLQPRVSLARGRHSRQMYPTGSGVL
jgi:hypothetical protein